MARDDGEVIDVEADLYVGEPAGKGPSRVQHDESQFRGRKGRPGHYPSEGLGKVPSDAVDLQKPSPSVG